MQRVVEGLEGFNCNLVKVAPACGEGAEENALEERREVLVGEREMRRVPAQEAHVRRGDRRLSAEGG
eukprot:4920160-Pleurochrysis_carterae.AAC.1